MGCFALICSTHNPVFFFFFFYVFFHLHRSHQCGLQLVIWQVSYRSIPSLFFPLSPSLSLYPSLPRSLVNLLPDPPIPLLQASPCSSRSTASPCPWVWRSTASPSFIWYRWGNTTMVSSKSSPTHTHLTKNEQPQKRGDENEQSKRR